MRHASIPTFIFFFIVDGNFSIIEEPVLRKYRLKLESMRRLGLNIGALQGS